MGARPLGRVIMVQGTMSHAGKSVLAAALCRIFVHEGLSVAPFKAQNMSNNSFVTPDGGEIGRAQAVQAEAARVLPRVEMNPVLLKPEADHRSQVVVLGRPTGSATARDYYAMTPRLWPVVAGALDRLRQEFDMVVIEGAGSPAEINLKAHEIVNMRVARHARAPVLLVGDIDRGGLFASLVGTMALLDPEEAALVRGFVVNKFRGDLSLLTPGLEELRRLTGIPVLGVLPYVTDIALPEEDSVGLEGTGNKERWPGDGERWVLDVAVVRLPRIANFDDFDPLRREPGVRLRYVASAADLGAPDLVVLPGSKSTIADLAWLRERGLAEAIVARRHAGAGVIGICGGYQMLGRRLLDPGGVESSAGEAEGLGLLPVTTRFEAHKETHQVRAQVARAQGMLAGCAGAEATGYEIHMGRTEGEGGTAPFRLLDRSGQRVDYAEGAMDAEGRTLGTYVHGLFHNEGLRRGILAQLASWKGVRLPKGAPSIDADKELDRLAHLVRRHLDMDLVFEIAGVERRRV